LLKAFSRSFSVFTSLLDHRFFQPLLFLSVGSLASFRGLLREIFGSLIKEEYTRRGIKLGDLEIVGPDFNQVILKPLKPFRK